ncbi:MAG: hypothetical protein ACOY82_03195 [Pseudomonadota bacterium]
MADPEPVRDCVTPDLALVFAVVNSPCRRRISAACRRALLALLALCLAAQPMFASWGDLHERIAHADTQGAKHGELHDESHDDGSTRADSAGGDLPFNPWHDLMHHAHCCAQPQLPVLAQLPLPAFELFSTAPLSRVVAAVADTHPASPFRPPIAG